MLQPKPLPRTLTSFARAGAGCPQAHGSEPEYNAYVSSLLTNPATYALSDDGKLTVSDKIILVGSASIGKTALVNRFSKGTYAAQHRPTIGLELSLQEYIIHNVKFCAQVWDTAGQEKFRAVSTAYYRGARGCILAFDLGNPESFAAVRLWLKEILGVCKREDVAIFLVGLKSDMFHAISFAQGASLAEEIKAEYFECSAKLNYNVTELFDRVAMVLFARALSYHAESGAKAVFERKKVDISKQLEAEDPNTNGGSRCAKC
eukprot:gnl/Hemi2/7166_TR2446_c0_g1_i1.p1 gnl/Hemi2/7166_TR2446_c0_g1~~gnl/Hemi2/7166_TR2446_c0_g1_i1.p1  ORF type:complete len:261 (+),score=54.24 gnl/Hemi2/7166_TR2446_c0_g1_i1:186-968(+)